jgi:hypothetical protein
MSAERKVEPSAWLIEFWNGERRAVASEEEAAGHVTPGPPHNVITPTYTLDASRLVWAERLEERAAELKDMSVWPVAGWAERFAEADELCRAARWLRSQDAP